MSTGIRNANNVTVPPGAYNPSPEVLCFPADWDDIALFIVANYVTHAATAIITHGSGWIGIAYALAKAFFFPAASAIHGTDAIGTGAAFAATDLEKAVRASAVLTKRAEDPDYKNSDCLYGQATARTSSSLLFSGFHGHTPDKQQRFRFALTNDIGLWCPQHCKKAAGAICNRRCPHHPGSPGCAPDRDPERRQCDHSCTHHCSPPAAAHNPCRRHCPGEADPENGYACPGCRLHCPPQACNGPCSHHAQQPASGQPAPAQPPGCPKHCRTQPIRLPYGYDGLKAIVAMFQIGFAITTVVRTAVRGNQLKRYGYAAFGLTVIPYAIMSLVHLFGAVIRPRFHKVYLLDGTHQDLSHDALFDENGAIQLPSDLAAMAGIQNSATTSRCGVCVRKCYSCLHRGWAVLKSWLHLESKKGPKWINAIILASLVVAASLAIIGGMTRFDPGESTAFQRGATMAWLVSGVPVAFLDSSVWACKDERSALRWTWIRRMFMLVIVAGPVCGFVAMGKMLKEYGVCVRT